MQPTISYGQKIKQLLVIFFPILIYQLANFSTSFIDTMMTGRYETAHLAGVSVGGSLWMPVLTFLTGLTAALVPIVGQSLGHGDDTKIKRELYQFLYLSLILAGLVLIIGTVTLPFILSSLNLQEVIAEVAFRYLVFLAFGLVPFLLFTVLRFFMDALGLTRLSMYLMLLIVPFNAMLNYLFIYGKFGFPSLGGAGAGLGTALSYWVLLVIAILVFLFHPQLKRYRILQPEKFSWPLIREGLKLGLPIGGMSFAEVAFFAVVGLFMTKFSTEVIAAHQSAINFAGLLYAFPLANSLAMAIVVSFEVGAKRYRDARQYAYLGLGLGMVFSSMTLLFLYLNRFWIAELYGKDLAFITLVTHFLTYSLLFQLADAFAAPVQGILRGYKDTRVPFMLSVMSYWGLSIPLGILLDQATSLGPYAYWVGLSTGLFISGLALGGRLLYIQKKYKEKE